MATRGGRKSHKNVGVGGVMDIRAHFGYWKEGIEPMAYSASLAGLLFLGALIILKFFGLLNSDIIRIIFLSFLGFYIGIVLPYVVGRYIKGWSD